VIAIKPAFSLDTVGHSAVEVVTVVEYNRCVLSVSR
jgi:hypothetical protein